MATSQQRQQLAKQRKKEEKQRAEKKLNDKALKIQKVFRVTRTENKMTNMPMKM
jgi:hypothetical protein